MGAWLTVEPARSVRRHRPIAAASYRTRSSGEGRREQVKRMQGQKAPSDEPHPRLHTPETCLPHPQPGSPGGAAAAWPSHAPSAVERHGRLGGGKWKYIFFLEGRMAQVQSYETFSISWAKWGFPRGKSNHDHRSLGFVTWASSVLFFYLLPFSHSTVCFVCEKKLIFCWTSRTIIYDPHQCFWEIFVTSDYAAVILEQIRVETFSRGTNMLNYQQYQTLYSVWVIEQASGS